MFLEQELLEHLGEEIRDVIGAGHESDAHDAPMSGLPNTHVPARNMSGSIRRRIILSYVDARRVVDVTLRRLQLFETQIEGQSAKMYDLV